MKSKAPVKCIKLLTGQEDVSSIISYLSTALLHMAWLLLSISRHVPLSGHDDVALFE